MRRLAVCVRHVALVLRAAGGTGAAAVCSGVQCAAPITSGAFRAFRAFRAAAIVCCMVSGALCTSCIKQVRDDELSIYNPTTFSFYNSDLTYDLYFTDPVAKAITARTGITLDVQHPHAVNRQEIPLMIASGRYADLIYAKSDITRLIESGALVALDDWVAPDGTHVNLIETYGAHLKELYGDQLVKLRHTDGHIYSFGVYDVQNEIAETSGTMQLQHAVLKELGYPKIATLEEYATALRAYRKKYPEIDGQPTIGLSLITDSWYWYIGLSNTANYVIGYPDDGQWIVDRDTHRAQYKFLHPQIARYYRWLNDLNSDGTLDPESFTQSADIWNAKIASGRVLGIAFPNWGYEAARKELIVQGRSERTYAYLPVVVDETRYKDPSLTDYGFSGGWGISIARTCPNVVLAFKFMDWMCSEEAQILVNWGLEGVNYEVRDGRRVVPESEQLRSATDPEYSKRTGVELWAYPFPCRGSGALDAHGDRIARVSRQNIVDTYLPVEKETLAAYGATVWTDLFPQPEELARPVHGQVWQYQLPREVNDRVAAADEYVHTTLTECILCPPEEFDARWERMVQTLRDMGMEQAGDAVSEQIQAKLRLWGVE